MATRINILTKANASKIRKDKRNGRDVIIVPSATMPDDVVMNNIKYPSAEIAKSFTGLERSPAPFDHPKVNGNYVSARDPEGLQVGWIGAWNENVRRKNGRVFLDKVIDVEIANSTVNGKRVMEAIEKGEPIHTSTGLICDLVPVANATDHKHEAHNIRFDHDAILLDVNGAATPAQGVGIFVNSSGESENVDVINSALDAADSSLDWQLESLVSTLERRKRAPMIDRLKKAIIEFFDGDDPTETTQGSEQMNREEMDALAATIATATATAVSTAVGNALNEALKPITDAQAANAAAIQAAADAAHAEAVTKVVANKMLDEVDAKAAPIAVLNALLSKLPTNAPAAPVLGGFNANDGRGVYKAPAAAK